MHAPAVGTLPGREPINLLLIMTDQHRRDHLSAYDASKVRTPALDGLAQRGCVMDRAYSPIPLCVPARCALMSGRYASSLGFTDNERRLGPGDFSIAASLAQAGYQRAMVGKNHAYSSEALNTWDFCECYAFHGKEERDSRTAPTASDRAIRDWRVNHVPYFESAIHEPQPGPPEADPTVRQTDDALRFLKERDRDRPFFMYLSYEAPHFPYVLPEPWFSRADPRAMPGPSDWPPSLRGRPARLAAQSAGLKLDHACPDDIRRVQATYRGMIESVDRQVARVLEAIEQEGLAGCTLIVFCSDHGDFMGDLGLIGKSVVLYENLLRVPMILAGPGVPSACRRDAYVDLTDVTPTVLELLGLPMLPGAQGRSFARSLTDAHQPHRRWVVAEHAFGRDEGMTPEAIQAMLAERSRLEQAQGDAWFLDALRGRTTSVLDTHTGYKLIRHQADADELFDLHRDPAERCNLAGQAQYADMHRLLSQRLDRIDFASPDLFERVR